MGLGNTVGIIGVAGVAPGDFVSFEIHVDSEDGGEDIFSNCLAVIERVIGVTFISHGDIEIAIWTEMHVATVVVVCVVGLVDEDALAGKICAIGATGQRGEPRDALLANAADGDRIEDIEIAVSGVVRVEGDAEKAALAAGVDGFPARR